MPELTAPARRFVLPFFRALFTAPPTDAAGNRVLALPRFFGLLGLVTCAAGVAIPLSVLAAHGPGQVGLAWLGLLFFTGPGLYLVLSTYVHRLILTPTQVRERHLLGGISALRWEQIQAVRFNKASLLLTLSDGHHQVQCHAYVRGFEELVQALTKHLGQSREELAIPGPHSGPRPK